MNENVSKWPVEDLLKATAVVRDIADMLARDALSTLVMSDWESHWGEMNDDEVTRWRELLEAHDPVQRDRFIHTLRCAVSAARGLADGIETVIAKSNTDLPDPDDVSIPDTVPDDWENQFDPSGDCVAVDYDRCPACGEQPDFCQGHGEIGDNDGFVIVQAHDNGIHEHCLTVEDVLGKEVR